MLQTRTNPKLQETGNTSQRKQFHELRLEQIDAQHFGLMAAFKPNNDGRYQKTDRRRPQQPIQPIRWGRPSIDVAGRPKCFRPIDDFSAAIIQ